MSSPLISASHPTSSPRLENRSVTGSANPKDTVISPIDDTNIHGTGAAVRFDDSGWKGRIPMSGIQLFGRRWLLGADDLFIPALISIIFCTIMWGLVIAVYALTFSITLPDTCSPQHMQNILLAHVIIWCFTVINDIAIAVSSLKTNMFYKNPYMHPLLYIRTFVAILIAAAVCAYTWVYVRSYNNECTEMISTETRVLHQSSLALLILLWILVSMGVCLVTCTAGIGQVCAHHANPHHLWTQRLRRIFCCCDHPTAMSTDRDVMTSIATLFGEFFKNEGNVHVVPSDILVGLALVEASQTLKQRGGHRYRYAASHLRWNPKHAISSYMVGSPIPYTPPEYMSLNSSPESNISTQPPLQHASTAELPRTHGPEPDHTKDIKVATLDHVPIVIDESKTSPPPTITSSITTSSSPTATSPKSPTTTSPLTTTVSPTSPSTDSYGTFIPPTLRTSSISISQDDRTEPNTEGDLIASAEQGIQPQLMPQDWERLAEARYFAKYAHAAYGWPLYMFDNMSCVFQCRACRPCQHAGIYPHDRFTGSGCGCIGLNTRCCHWSINAFMIQSKLPREDILFANVVTSPVYYVCVDRVARRLIIACRGTMSVSDLIIDMDAKLVALDNFGFPGSYTHIGIYENAMRCRDSIEKMGLVKTFMENNPDYGIYVCGHSLGAGTATVLTLMLRDQYQHRDLRCLALASPLLLDANTANHPFVLDRITSIVYGNDMVPRLSLSTLFQLKRQMQLAFDIARPYKLDILSSTYLRRYSRVFEPNIELDTLDLYKRIRLKEVEEEKQRSEKLLSTATSSDSSTLMPSHVTTVTHPNSSNLNNDGVIIQTKDTVTSITKPRSGTLEFHYHLRRCYLPGRIYHILPNKIKEKRKWLWGSKTKTVHTVYPSAQETFQEIRMTRSTFLHHLPSRYWLRGLDIPEQYDYDIRLKREVTSPRTVLSHIVESDNEPISQV